MSYIKSGNHTFKIVDKIPSGYVIWNIGKNMIDGYLHICQVGGYDGCSVNTETLKAIKSEGAQIILSVTTNGQNTPKSMERYIKRYANAKPNHYSYRQRERIIKALPYMYDIFNR